MSFVTRHTRTTTLLLLVMVAVMGVFSVSAGDAVDEKSIGNRLHVTLCTS